MRYWLYQDSRIFGPFSAEDLASTPGVGPRSLVCEADSSGASESDWREAGAVLELSGGPVAVAEAAGGKAESGFYDFQRGAHSFFDSAWPSDEWTQTLMSDPNFAALWPPLGGLSTEEFTSYERDRMSEMEERLGKLKAELREYETHQKKFREELREKERLLEEKEQALEELRRRLESKAAGGLEAPALERLRREAFVEKAPPSPARGEQAAPPRTALPEAPSLPELPKIKPRKQEEPAPLPARGEAAAPPRAALPEAPPLPARGEAAALARTTLPEAPPLPARGEAAALARTTLPEAPPLQAPEELELPEPEPLGTGASAAAAPSPARGETTAPARKALPEAPPSAVLDQPSEPQPEEAIPPQTAPAEISAGQAAPEPSAQITEEAVAAPQALPPPVAEAVEEPAEASAAPAERMPLDTPPPAQIQQPQAAQAEPQQRMESALPDVSRAPETEAAAGAADDQVWDFAPELTPLKSTTDLPPAMDFDVPRTVIFSSAPDGALEMSQAAAPAFQATAYDSAADTPGYPTVIPAMQGEGFQAPGEPAGVPAFDPSEQLPEGAPPQPMPFGAEQDFPQGEEQGIVMGPPSEAVVIPGFGGEPGEQTGAADIFSGGTPASIPLTGPAGAAPQDMPANLWSTPTPVADIPAARPFDDLFATRPTPVPSALRTPADASVPETKKKRRSKGFLIILGVSVAVLIGVAFFFLRNPKDIQTMFTMGPQKKESQAQGSAAGPEGPQAPAQPKQGARQAAQTQKEGQQQSPQAQQQPSGPEPQQNPAPAQPAKPQAGGRDFIRDESIQSIEFVKNHYLDKERGTINQWLQYSFQTTSDNATAWDAGGISSAIYVVTYSVKRGTKVKFKYNFEVDLAKKTIIGRNQEALSLLNSGKPVSAKPHGGASLPSQRTPKGSAKAEDEQAPLPDESELESNRRQGGARFNNPGADTVNLSP
ncbi:MAG: hypothetical protein HY922_03085 [Elusimicrobia bacterium]|nr:hypothetical protein [Elusimicrobiota bacterium]